MKTIAFFNNKGGVGKTSLVYHLAWMMALSGRRVLVADLDPQANATSIFLDEDQIEALWLRDDATIYDGLRPLINGVGDVAEIAPYEIDVRLHLLSGHLSLSKFEDQLSETWPKCLIRDERAFRVTTAFSRAVQSAGRRVNAEIALIDVGPNLGAINRAALVASDFVVAPLAPDLFAVRGLENVGPTLRDWRDAWGGMKTKAPEGLRGDIPDGNMSPIGYVVSRYTTFARGPVKAYKKWLDRTPGVYRKSVLALDGEAGGSVDDDPNKLATLKDYRSLMPMAQEARKPMFLLKPADGAIGGHQAAVNECYEDFRVLAEKILARAGLPAQ